jgi:HK97 family phage portal protein
MDRRAWSWLLADPTADVPVPLPATRDEALSIPAFGRGVELLASTVAGVPIDAFRFDPDRGVDMRLADQPTILTDPDPMVTAWHWRYAAAKDLVEAGNHVALLGDVDWRTGRPGWLVPLPVAEVGLLEDANQPGWYAFAVAGVMLDPSEVLHISAGNRSGEILGQGVIAQYGEQLGGQLAAEQWASRYVAAGGLPPAIIQHPSVTPGDQAKADDLKTRWRTLVRTGEAMVLPAGAVVTPLQSDAERQQLVQARTWNSQLAGMVLGIPPHMLGLPGPNMTYQNVQSADVAFIRDVVTRWSDPINMSLTKWLLPAGTEARARWAARARTDMETQAKVAAALVAAGIWTVDEARQSIGYEPMDGATDTETTPEGVPNLGAVEEVA